MGALRPVFSLRGGNCNNGSKCGRYVNVNNAASNANWNIGASLLLPLSFYRQTRASGFDTDNASIFPQPMLKINPPRGAAGKRVRPPNAA